MAAWKTEPLIGVAKPSYRNMKSETKAKQRCNFGAQKYAWNAVWAREDEIEMRNNVKYRENIPKNDQIEQACECVWVFLCVPKRKPLAKAIFASLHYNQAICIRKYYASFQFSINLLNETKASSWNMNIQQFLLNCPLWKLNRWVICGSPYLITTSAKISPFIN